MLKVLTGRALVATLRGDEIIGQLAASGSRRHG
jgi:hypothetical protein